MKKSEALKTLGLQEGASEDDIKKAHRKLIIANHPDKFGQDEAARAKAEEKTKLINEARDVLLNHSWDPEYTTSGTPYGAPFSYNPYTATRPQGGQAGQGTPFEGWPFSETFVWTTWDENGNKTTYTSTGGNPFAGSPFGANPFSWADPFGRLCWLFGGQPLCQFRRWRQRRRFERFSVASAFAEPVCWAKPLCRYGVRFQLVFPERAYEGRAVA